MRLVTWDPAKAESNIEKHGVSFGEAQEVLDDLLSITVLDHSQPLEEERFLTIGQSLRRRLLTVGHADSDDEVWIITARDSTRRERKTYEEDRVRHSGRSGLLERRSRKVRGSTVAQDSLRAT
jgi:uncharacterized DUF497 family protein